MSRGSFDVKMANEKTDEEQKAERNREKKHANRNIGIETYATPTPTIHNMFEFEWTVMYSSAKKIILKNRIEEKMRKIERKRIFSNVKYSIQR